MSFPVARVAPNGFRGVIRRVGICDVGTLFDQQRFEPRTPRILCDESGQLYEWSAEQLKPLSPHQLPNAIVATPDRGFHPLFPEPGCPLVVHWNEFRSLLEPQIAHPERLRVGHRVGVRAQVYEVLRPQSIGQLAESITGDCDRSSELAILTDTLASLLGLAAHVPPRVRQPYPQPDADMIMAHERIVRLQLTSDPTANAPAAQPSPRVATRHADATSSPRRADKETIPQAFLRPWEFMKSREEVLYELTRRRGIVSTLRSWMSAMASRLGGRLEYRRWQVLRSGKSLDEQLWSVRPPRRGFEDRGVRDWVARTLEQGGYSVPAMLLEWEIFWRRKLG